MRWRLVIVLEHVLLTACRVVVFKLLGIGLIRDPAGA
jgi:hypothetical protein